MCVCVCHRCTIVDIFHIHIYTIYIQYTNIYIEIGGFQSFQHTTHAIHNGNVPHAVPVLPGEIGPCCVLPTAHVF